MNIDFKICLQKRKITPFSRGKFLFKKELKTAQDDLITSKQSFSERNYKWATIQAYYSMFHSARALLYAENYKEKSHNCLIKAIRFLYVDKGLLDFDSIEALQKGKNLREGADYYSDFNLEVAAILIKQAGHFLKKAREILIK